MKWTPEDHKIMRRVTWVLSGQEYEHSLERSRLFGRMVEADRRDAAQMRALCSDSHGML